MPNSAGSYSPLPPRDPGEMPLHASDEDLPEVVDTPHYEAGDSFKTAVPRDTEAADTFKGVKTFEGANPDDNHFKTAVTADPEDDTLKTAAGANYITPDSYDSANENAAARNRTICGIRRKFFWIGLGVIIAIIVIVGAVVGGVLGSRHSTKSTSPKSSNSNSTTNGTHVDYSGRDILPGSALTVSNTNNTVRLFYQNGDGDILYKRAAFPGNGDLGKYNNLNVTDAKLFTPLATTGPVDEPSQVTIFYLTQNNSVRAVPFTGSNTTDLFTGLEALDLQVKKDSKLSALYLPGGQTNFYYQADNGYINEYVYTKSGGWSHHGTLDEGANGTAISTGWVYESDNPSLRVYFLHPNNTLVEYLWDTASGWNYGAAPAHQYDEGSQLYDITWTDVDGNPSNRIYGTDRNNEVFEIGDYYGTWSGAAWSDKKVIGNTVNVSYPVAAAEWFVNANMTDFHVKVFFQEEEDTLTMLTYTDAGGWGDGQPIDLTS